MMLFLIFYHTEMAILLPTHCSLQKSYYIGHYSLLLLIPLEIRKAGGWGWRAVRTLANMPAEGPYQQP